MNKTGVMICGHGSRDVRAVEEFASLQSSLAARLPEYTVEYGFLEFAKPIIRDGLDKLRDQGINHVLAVPGMLFSAGHVKNDIASVLNEYQRSQNDPLFKIEYGRPLDIDTRMLYASEARIREAITAAPSNVPIDETLIMVVGGAHQTRMPMATLIKYADSFGKVWDLAGEKCATLASRFR